MNRKSNLHNALKKAFEDHKEPLHETQWDRLNAALDKEKPRRRRFVLWFFITAVIFSAAIGAGVWFMKPSTSSISQKSNPTESAVLSHTVPSASHTAQSHKDSLIQLNSEKETTVNKEPITSNENSTTVHSLPHHSTSNKAGENEKSGLSAPSSTKVNPLKRGTKKNAQSAENNSPTTNNSQGIASKEPNTKEPKKKNKNVKDHTSETSRPANDGNASGNGNSTADNSKTSVNNAGSTSDNPNHKSGTEDEIKDNTNTVGKMAVDNGGLKTQKTKDSSSALTLNTKGTVAAPAKDDTTSKNSGGGKNNNNGNGGARKKFAIGFSSGYSNMNIKVQGISNSEKIHQDTRSLFDRMNQHSTSRFFNFSFDCYPLKNLSLTFNSGVQYRQIDQLVNFDYKLNELPFRDIDGSITGYLFVPDSSNPLIFHAQGHNQLNYVNIPLKFGYTIPVNSKNEFIVSAGMNLSFMTKAAGQSFSVNDAEFKPLSEFYKNKTNIGWMGGIQFSHNIYKPWWLGIEGQWQQNKYNYYAGYGVISSRISISNYNMCVRYKF